jgi:hypothetical protein
MRNPMILLRSVFQLAVHPPQSHQMKQNFLFQIALGFLISCAGLYAGRGLAASPETAPPQLKQAITQIDTAASNKNVKAVLEYYSQTFKNSDGLTRQTLEQSLEAFWKRYSNLKYRTELTSWQNDGKGISAETVTYITGVANVDNREMNFNATLKSRQRFENQKIVQQEVLSEQVELTTGANPPKVKLNLPAQVKAGQEYQFDAIVQEPLGEDLLLGSAIEEPVQVTGYLKPSPVNLELLSAGGIFKVGRAPNTGDDRWVSAVLVRGDGMTFITQRLKVTGRGKAK